MNPSPLDRHRDFWIRTPALKLGTTALLSISPPLSILWLSYLWLLFRKKVLVHALLCLFFALYAHYFLARLPDSQQGQFVFHVHSLQRYASPFQQQGWLYQGTLAGMIPCSIVYYGEKRPKGNCNYLVTGELKKRAFLQYRFKAMHWDPIHPSWSLAELRYSTKANIKALLLRHLHPKTASFLLALFTGEREDRILTFEFARLGLQHILAISGFHFAILIALFSFGIRQLCSSYQRIWLLFALALLYFLFVGDSPPVFRTFCMLSLFLGGQLLRRCSTGLNLLGATLFIELLLNPLDLYTIGFQLSFLSCAGILFFNEPIMRSLGRLFPSRSFETLKQLSPPSQCGAIVLFCLKKALAITLAVNIALLPVLLYHFHRFPLLSLFYNLFVPELVSLSLVLLLVSLACYAAIPLLGVILLKATDFITSELLELIAFPPTLIEYSLSAALPLWSILVYLVGLFSLGIHNTRSGFEHP
jgi:competence protein ComEC